jgi:hypothetical protein
MPARADRALVLDCGSGWLETALAPRGRFRSIVACDFAPEPAARARSAAEAEGLSTIGLLARLCAVEQRLTEAGQIEPDFRIFVGAHRESPPVAAAGAE